MNEMTINNEKPRKRKLWRKITVAIAMLLILSISITAFSNHRAFANTLALMSKDPVEYYAYVEKNAFKKTLTEIAPYFKNYKKMSAYRTSTDITYDYKTIDSLLKTYTGTGLKDFENYLGLRIDKLNFDTTVAFDENVLYENIGFNLNDADIISMEIFFDSAKKEMLMRMPELSPAYLKDSFDYGIDYAKLLNLQNELFSSSRSIDFLTRYSDIIIDHITNVKLTKNVNVKTDTLSANCNQLEVTIDYYDLQEMVISILYEAKEDRFIHDLLPFFRISEEDYRKAIEQALTSVQNPDNADLYKNSKIKMLVYVDGNGTILGRDIRIENNEKSMGALGYTTITKNDYEEYNIYVKNEENLELVKIYGNQTKEKDIYDGSLTFELNGLSSDFLSNIKFDIRYEDSQVQFKDGEIYQYGTYTISSPLMMGMELILKYDVVDRLQQQKMILQMGSSSLVTLDTRYEYLDDFKIPAIDKKQKVYKMDKMDKYLSKVDMDAYINGLSEKLGVDVQSILNKLGLK